AASNPGRDEPFAGLTRLESGPFLRDAIEADRHRWGTPNLLVKLLDPIQRLPVHAHPDRTFPLERLGSEYGKTEAWFVVATRAAEVAVWVGLRDTVSKEEYRDWIERQDTDALLGSLNHLALEPGDAVYVPAGVPHAIGGGALVVELQEPT